MKDRSQIGFRISKFDKERFNKLWKKSKSKVGGTKAGFMETIFLENLNNLLDNSKTVNRLQRNIEEDYRDFVLKLAKKGTFKNGAMVIQLEQIGLSSEMSVREQKKLAKVSRLIKAQGEYILEMTIEVEGCQVLLKKKGWKND